MNKVREFGRSFPAIVADEAMGNIAEWAMSGVIGISPIGTMVPPT